LTPQQILVASLAQLGLALCLAGVAARGRFRVSRGFTLYLAACLVGNVSVTLWPEVFFTRSWWVARSMVYNSLRLATALELVYWTFSAMPGAHRTARRVLLAILGLTFVSLVFLPDGGGEDSIRQILLPRMLNGTIWLFAATVGVSLLYRVPVHPWHRAIMTGFAAYLTVFTVLLRLLAVLGWEVLDLMNTLEPLSYVVLLGYWTWAAWRTDESPAIDPAILGIIQPWRA
jgi:hypothetical protein